MSIVLAGTLAWFNTADREGVQIQGMMLLQIGRIERCFPGKMGPIGVRGDSRVREHDNSESLATPFVLQHLGRLVPKVSNSKMLAARVAIKPLAARATARTARSTVVSELWVLGARYPQLWDCVHLKRYWEDFLASLRRPHSKPGLG